jgi:predicted Na+-dependent transporter
MAGMAHVLDILSNGAVLLFVVTTMLAMGLSLTVSQILIPLQHARLVVLALVANFLLVPLLALALTFLIPLSEPLKIGLILLGTAAGAPFLPKLAQFAHGNVAYSVGLMVLLMVVSIPYLPLVLPLVLPGVRVDPLAIAVSLVLTMLLPLGIALVVRARYPEPAGQLQPLMGQASNAALVLVFVTSLLANLREIIGVIGTGGILAVLILIVGGIAIGYLLAGPSGDTRTVLGLGTGQRNISAALLVSTQSFTDPQVLALVLVGSTVGLFALLPLALELGRRTARRSEAIEGAKPVGPSVETTGEPPPTGAAPTVERYRLARQEERGGMRGESRTPTDIR